MKTLEIAKDIVFLCRKYRYDFNNTKIQKLLYLFVGFCLINQFDEIYDIDEKPKLWPFGPVFPRVHKKYNDLAKTTQDKIISVQNKEMQNILEETVKQWGVVPAGKLSAWSHEDGSPWDVMTMRGDPWNTEINLDYIKVYFLRNVENVINNN